MLDQMCLHRPLQAQTSLTASGTWLGCIVLHVRDACSGVCILGASFSIPPFQLPHRRGIRQAAYSRQKLALQAPGREHSPEGA